MSKNDLKKKSIHDSGNGSLVREIDVITKALYEDKAQPRSSIPTASSRSKSVVKPHLPEAKSKSNVHSNEDSFLKDKKSIWNWKALKAFTHVRNKKFNCCFSLQVHSIEGLPASFNDLRLCVNWKRRDGELTTRPATVLQGVAEFEELLTTTCSVYGSRSGPHHSAKYEAKHFLLYASVFGDPELDLGKHRVDLTRLLPLTLEELEEEKSSGKWTTSYKLSGKAKGASINVSFGYSLIGNCPSVPAGHNATGKVKPPGKTSGKSDGQSPIKRGGSLPVRSRAFSRSVEDIKDLHEILPISKSELSESVNMLYQKLDEEKSIISVDCEPQRDVETVPLEPPIPASHMPDPDKGNGGDEFSVSVQGIDFSTKEQLKPEEGTLMDCEEEEGSWKGCDGLEKPALEEDLKPELVQVKKSERKKEEPPVIACSTKEQDLGDKESLIKELESALKCVVNMVKEEYDSQEESDSLKEVKLKDEGVIKGMEDVICSSELGSQDDESENLDQKNYMELKSDYKATTRGKSLSLDCATDAVASDFLDMLGIEHSPFGLSSESEPDSPRGRLLRQFEKDALAGGSSIFNFNIDDDETGFSCGTPSPPVWGPISEESGTSSMLQVSEEMLKLEIQEGQHKTKASILEDLETEALMREWGLNEKAFQCSPPNGSGGLGSPIDLPPEESLELPSLGVGLGPFVRTSNGGFLRSMNPEIFRNAKSGGSLIMQVSSPVVVPAEMGSGIMDILQCLASVGIEKLSMQANKVMPLEDITGMTMQQIAWEASPSLEAAERRAPLQQEQETGRIAPANPMRLKGQPSGTRSKYESSSVVKEKDPEYVSLEDLAPLAMDKIEALSIEGLRIQSGMSNKDAPSNISPQSIGEISALEGKRVNFGGSLGLEGTGGLQLLDIKESGDEDVDGIMSLSITLDEWMRLDSGEIDDGDEITERTSRILAAHHASDLMRARSGDRRRGKGSRRGGLLGNNFTVALMVQLRDPLRNFEPVGTPMLALIQVERVFVPSKPKIYSTVSELWKNLDDEDDVLPVKKEKVKEEEKVREEEIISVPQFKITEVHVAGLKTEPNKKKLWGSSAQQQQSGSRWLLANGMGKKNTKHPLMKSKAAAGKSSSSDSLWSISSKAKGPGKVDPPVRNPNVIIPNETVKLLSGAGFV